MSSVAASASASLNPLSIDVQNKWSDELNLAMHDNDSGRFTRLEELETAHREAEYDRGVAEERVRASERARQRLSFIQIRRDLSTAAAAGLTIPDESTGYWLEARNSERSKVNSQMFSALFERIKDVAPEQLKQACADVEREFGIERAPKDSEVQAETNHKSKTRRGKKRPRLAKSPSPFPTQKLADSEAGDRTHAQERQSSIGKKAEDSVTRPLDLHSVHSRAARGASSYHASELRSGTRWSEAGSSSAPLDKLDSSSRSLDAATSTPISRRVALQMQSATSASLRSYAGMAASPPALENSSFKQHLQSPRGNGDPSSPQHGSSLATCSSSTELDVDKDEDLVGLGVQLGISYFCTLDNIRYESLISFGVRQFSVRSCSMLDTEVYPDSDPAKKESGAKQAMKPQSYSKHGNLSICSFPNTPRTWLTTWMS
ncbi:hypothetical protein IE81DRAFT_341963 [Ceraceosorus guamensis]|uniref:Uncharacterized protein n=1 Tax=Ceraceosorus guamensis TaxID=1522189 RepID=A0A316VXK8_9BASI|nr:hypothetical protein IE81DRAFT_341963 [Ceraceosorus guamensis]PWN41628.1 hypothetical protein IE81DRAFT_341963 [Ceraceosorus guamensis]